VLRKFNKPDVTLNITQWNSELRNILGEYTITNSKFVK